MREFTVSEINSHIKHVVTGDFLLNNICVKGEISNCKYHDNGHIYFTLKDEKSSIRAVMWKSVPKPDFMLEDGMQVIVTGSVSVYEAGGYYQISAKEINMSGVGDLYIKLAELKEEFAEMGYFAEQYKKKIPEYAMKIGIVTARTGAALQDICSISRDRNPYVSLYLCPALVQGNMAAQSIVSGIQKLDLLNLDVIIIGRGGGSIEDLWAFNEREVAEAVFRAQTPIVSAVGHETDDTLTDLIADRRAATPSDAARIAVCEFDRIISILSEYKCGLQRNIRTRTDYFKKNIENVELKLKSVSPIHMLSVRKNNVKEKKELLDRNIKAALESNKLRPTRIKEMLSYSINKRMDLTKEKMSSYAGRLSALSPLNLLSRGYGYIEDMKGKRINTVKDIKPEDEIKIYFVDGNVKARIEEKNEDERKHIGK